MCDHMISYNNKGSYEKLKCKWCVNITLSCENWIGYRFGESLDKKLKIKQWLQKIINTGWS